MPKPTPPYKKRGLNVTLFPSATLCDGESVTLTISGASIYLWAPALGLNNTSGNSVVATPNTATTYIVTGTDINNCSDIIS